MEPEMSEWLASLSSTISLTHLALGPLSAQDTRQIVRELTGTDGVHPSLPGDTCDKSGCYNQPSSQPVQPPGSGICPERSAAWLFAATNAQPSYLDALL